MLDRFRWYVINVVYPKYASMAILAAFAALGTWMAAHAGLLEKYGVTYGIWPLRWAHGQVPSGPVILIELDTLSTAAYTAIIAGIAVLIRALQHHTVGAVTGPQPEAGGQRSSDPPSK